MCSDACGSHDEDTGCGAYLSSDGDARRKTTMLKKSLVTAIMTVLVMKFYILKISSDWLETLNSKQNFSKPPDWCISILQESNSSRSGLD